MTDCIICAIASEEIPATFVYQDDAVVAFRDIKPQAPTHMLVCPRTHVATIAELDETHDEVWVNLLRVVQKIAEDEKIADGFRVVINTGSGGGQTVDHLHLHLLGGRQMTWPPG